MALTLTPYVKNGIGTVSTSGSSTTTTCDTARGFRNVAVGATITAGGLTRTVVSKTDEQTISVDSSRSMSSVDWIIKRDKPNWVMVLIAMVECKNRGSL